MTSENVTGKPRKQKNPERQFRTTLVVLLVVITVLLAPISLFYASLELEAYHISQTATSISGTKTLIRAGTNINVPSSGYSRIVNLTAFSTITGGFDTYGFALVDFYGKLGTVIMYN